MKISKYNIVGSLAITVLFWNGSLLAKKIKRNSCWQYVAFLQDVGSVNWRL